MVANIKDIDGIACLIFLLSCKPKEIYRMEDLGNESSSTIKNKRSANIRAPFDIIDGFSCLQVLQKTGLQ
ncbi:MAG: hypothetical protein M3156_04440 [Thermoproteota archaeon]|jgi:hypothetical protein|nr:hypothetical protein [Thermoproteota archaeon]